MSSVERIAQSKMFELGDALIIDPEHVRVERLAPRRAGELAVYRKAFKETGKRDYRIWTEYEIQFFHLLALKNLKHVAQLASLSRKSNAGGAAQTMHLETFDCGPDLQQWCRVQPRYTDGTVAAHPFQHVAQYLQLLRACLVALKEIHQHEIVHGDIKQDNICLFYQPYPYDPEAGGQVCLDFTQLKLIDFAWSVSRDVPLEHALPISGANKMAYQAPTFKLALEEDRKSGKPNAVRKLDYRVDLYSLGHMAASLADIGLIPSRGEAGQQAYDGARRLGVRLKALGEGKKLGAMPHGGLITEIDGWLKALPGPSAYRFWVATAMVQAGLDAERVASTPMTPLAGVDEATPVSMPVQEPLPVLPVVRRWQNPALALPGLVLVGALGFMVWPKTAVLSTPVVTTTPKPRPTLLAPPVVQPVPVTVAPKPHIPGEVFHDVFAAGGGPGPEMVVIPPGSFMMGALTTEVGRSNRKGSQHEVMSAAAYALGKTPVTFDEWDACVKDGGCGGYAPSDSGWGRGKRPVINVNWDDAQQYIAWLVNKTGKPYRLPSEAEWGYAARAGTRTAYYWGDAIGNNQANCAGCGSQWDKKQTAPVGSFAVNGFGLHDMAGNVRQWTQDCWDKGLKNASKIYGSAFAVDGCRSSRVIRSGSWGDPIRYNRSDYNLYSASMTRNSRIGFRVARALP